MALIQTSKQIVTIRGRCGGNYFKHGTDGQHIQAMPRHVKFAHSPARSPGIGGFSTMAPLWLMALCAYFAVLWAVFALQNKFATKSGDRKRISAYNWYIHYALMFPEHERPPMWMAPAAPYNLPSFIVTGHRDTTMYRLTPDEWADWWPYDYFHDLLGIHNGEPVYQTEDSKWFVWWNGAKWTLSTGPGIIDPQKTWIATLDQINCPYFNIIRNHYIDVWPGKLSFYPEPD